MNALSSDSHTPLISDVIFGDLLNLLCGLLGVKLLAYNAKT